MKSLTNVEYTERNRLEWLITDLRNQLTVATQENDADRVRACNILIRRFTEQLNRLN